jgi:hypothetical protein
MKKFPIGFGGHLRLVVCKGVLHLEGPDGLTTPIW